ncbi:MAG: hypothetical protein ACKV2V_08740, partial [Blastocatellia bacterium]
SSPDGAWRIEEHDDYEYIHEGGIYRHTRVYAAGNELILELRDTSLPAPPAFLNQQEVDLELKYVSLPVRARLNLRNRTFVFHPHDFPRPFAEMPNALLELWQNNLRSPVRVISKGKYLGELLSVLGCFVFVAIGVFLLLYHAGTRADQYKALAVIVFFGLCGFVLLADLRKYRVK